MMNGDVLTALDYAPPRGRPPRERQSPDHRLPSPRRAHRVRRIHLDGKAGETRVVTGFEEKPELPYIVSMGVYVLEPRSARVHQAQPAPGPARPRARGCSKADAQVGAYVYDGYWLDIGRHEDYEKAILEFEQVKPLLMDEKGARDSASVPRAPRAIPQATPRPTRSLDERHGHRWRRLRRAPRRGRAAGRRARGQGARRAAARPGGRGRATSPQRGVELIRGDIRDADARTARARRAPRPWSTWPRSSAIPACARDPSCPTT